jgi:phage shock protein PspC (stress-responsive transcriptional regulator)
MNKTININLGGYFFHIDEIAYKKLKRYLDAIAKSLSDDPEGKNEIIADIEARICELLSEKITETRQVVNELDIHHIIKIMGEPEDYSDHDENFQETKSKSNNGKNNFKKLFRDRENRFISGVSSGIAHYLDLDVVWIRIAFILLTVFSGMGLIAYIVFWIVTPEAKTTAEKLQMEGERVTIDNIEKKIREEFSSIKETIEDGANNVKKKVADGFQRNGKNTTSGLQDFLNVIGNMITVVFNVIGKFIGLIIVIFSSIILISIFFGVFSLGSFELLGYGDNLINLPDFVYDSIIPYWILTICMFIVIGFPFLILFILGLRIISSNIKQFSKTVSLSLLSVWIVALLTIVFAGIDIGTSDAYNGTKIENYPLNLSSKDTLFLKMINDDELYFQDKLRRSTKRIKVEDNGVKKIYATNVKVSVEKSNTENFTFKIRKVSEGRNKNKATEKAAKIDYRYSIKDSTLKLNAFFLSHLNHRSSDEIVYVTIYVPEGNTVFIDTSTHSFLYRIKNSNNLYHGDVTNHFFEMTEKGLNCTDCIKQLKM